MKRIFTENLCYVATTCRPDEVEERIIGAFPSIVEAEWHLSWHLGDADQVNRVRTPSGKLVRKWTTPVREINLDSVCQVLLDKLRSSQKKHMD
tara:strand:+ start:239 stop:517 length:279 start_codon:yes stop_codon:yes gene_type:complete